MAEIIAPGVTSPYLIVPEVINASWDLGLTKTAEYQEAVDGLSDVGGIFDGLEAPTNITANVATNTPVVEPTITISDASTTGVYGEFQTQYLELVALLAEKFGTFQQTYFPNEQAEYAKAELWLSEALSDPSGLPATVRSQLLADEQAAILMETSRAKDAVLAQFAARRFPMPPGAAASATLQIEQSAQDKMAEASRNITKLSVENLRFAVEKSLALRQVALGAANEYIKALASGPDMASRLVNIGYDAQSKMVSAASQFYNARIQAAELANKVSQFNVSSKLTADERNQATTMSMIEAKIKALMAEAQALAQMATSLFNNIHVSTGTSASSSNSVGYSYSNDTTGAAPPIISV